MQSNLEMTSFEIGETFENYVQSIIFPKNIYDLIHRTNNYKQNSTRYSEESKRPDFKFRCKKSNQEFYVEAKFRSKFYSNDKLHIMDIGQYNRYKRLNQTECPVLVLIGYEDTASNPKALSLIRIGNIEYLDLYKSVLKKYEIDKKAIDYGCLNRIIGPLEQEIEPIPRDNSAMTKKRNVYWFFGIILLGLLVFAFFASNNDERTVTISKKKDSTKIVNLHSSVNMFDKNIIFCNSKSLIIRIDETDKGLRYASWSNERKTSEKPSLVLYNGVDKSEEFTEGEKWTFKNASWIYEISKVDVCKKPKDCGIYLRLYQYNKLKQTTELSEIR